MTIYCDLQWLNMVREFHEVMGHSIAGSPVDTMDATRAKARYDYLYEEYQELVHGVMACDYLEIADALCDLQYVLLGLILELGIPCVDRSSYPDSASTPRKGLQIVIKRVYQTLVETFDPKLLVNELQSLQDDIYRLVDNNSWQTSFHDMFKAVHNNNMTKACADETVAMATVDWYRQIKKINTYYARRPFSQGDRFVVYREDNNKIMKPLGYHPVDLTLWVGKK
jgi:hypothetical protein